MKPQSDTDDAVWKALSDATRRQILDVLRPGPRTTTEVVEQFPALSRFAVMKHLGILRSAGLVVTRRDGRHRIHQINAVPLQQIYDRWVSRFEQLWAVNLVDFKSDLEAPEVPGDGAAGHDRTGGDASTH